MRKLKVFEDPRVLKHLPPREQHFKNIVNMLWGKDNKSKHFVWHPWAEKMIEAACHNRYVAVGGCASSSKTDTYALWAIVNFVCYPHGTMVLVTSTSMKESRKRIWGSIRDYWNAVPGLPGKLVDSMGLIRYEVNGKSMSDKCGISLVAGEKKREKEAVGKMIGMKNERVIVVADELSELAESLLEVALPGGNLTSNPYCQLIGLSNPASYFDPFGRLWEPKDGWASITIEDEEWETKHGVGLHFDGLKSPNIIEGRTIYPFLPTQEKVDAARAETGGENTLRFWRMYRGWVAPKGNEDAIYAEADIIKFRAHEKPIWGDQPLTRVAALDPAFTNGGDRSILYFGWVGMTADGMKCLCLDKHEHLTEDMTDKTTPRTFQIAEKFKRRCQEEGVLPKHAAFDGTGAGGPFGDVVSRIWSNEVLRVQFGGAPSDLPVSISDPTPAKQRYSKRVSEIWFGAKELMQTGQLKGVSPDLVKELTSRRYSTNKGSGDVKLEVEKKEDMKARTGISPDIGDAAGLLCELCRQRLGFAAKQVTAEGRPVRQVSWNDKARQVNRQRYSPTNLLAQNY